MRNMFMRDFADKSYLQKTAKLEEVIQLSKSKLIKVIGGTAASVDAACAFLDKVKEEVCKGPKLVVPKYNFRITIEDGVGAVLWPVPTAPLHINQHERSCWDN